MEESTVKEKLEGLPIVSDYLHVDMALSDEPIMTAKEDF